MALALLLLTLLSYSAGVSSRSPWTQPASESVAPGQTAKLSCAVNSDGYTISWYQQKAGQAPRFVHYAGGSRGEGFSDKFTASVSGSIGYLTITNVQAGDEAGYYCLMWSNTDSMSIFGGGTHLSVSGGSPVPPTVNLFPPSKEEMGSKGKATLVCLVQDFHPGVVQVSWEADGTAVSSGVETTKPTKHNDKYMASSYLTVTPSDWESHNTYTCKVTHEGSNYVKSVSHSQCP